MKSLLLGFANASMDVDYHNHISAHFRFNCRSLFYLAAIIWLIEVAFNIFFSIRVFELTGNFSSTILIIREVLITGFLFTYSYWLYLMKQHTTWNKSALALEYIICIIMTSYCIYTNETNLEIFSDSTFTQETTKSNQFIFLGYDGAWRFLYSNLLFRYWQPRAILCVGIMTASIVSSMGHSNWPEYLLTRGIIQIIYLIIILYVMEQIKQYTFSIINELNAKDKIYRNVMDSMPESIIIFDSKGKIQFINQHFSKFVLRQRNNPNFDSIIKNNNQDVLNIFKDIKFRINTKQTTLSAESSIEVIFIYKLVLKIFINSL